MKVLLCTSSAMLVPSSQRTNHSWVIGCRMERYNPSALDTTSSPTGRINPTILSLDNSKDKIQKLFSNVELSVSSYDTAWVAMVPSPSSTNSPCFPDCLKWLMDNQHNDGSWGLIDHHNQPLIKDTLSSTLACILALKRWNVGEDHIKRGLCFIESNFASATDKNQPSPIGFHIIFPSMLEYAKDLNLKLHLKQTDFSSMLHERELELRRCDSNERKAYLAFISEGLGNSYNWDMVMKYQMKNGSLFNSPSATAAALMRHQNAECVDYLTSLLDKFGNAVPTVYPFDLCVRLSMVDKLERLGIARHFIPEIRNVLDETYRCWVQKYDHLFMDVATCARAFRVLRMNGYEVSVDPLAKITKEQTYMSSLEDPFKDIYAALEVYRASQIIYQEELLAFGVQTLRSTDFLKQNISTATIPSNRLFKMIHQEVDNAFKFPFNSGLERIVTRRNIEHYNVDNTKLLKTACRSPNISNEDFLMLAVEDFNECQSICQGELKGLERWVAENRLNELKFARQKSSYCYFSAASVLSTPELSDARLSWAKSSFLLTIVDDFFDVGGSMDELTNLIDCVERWDVNADTDCCSEEVRIIFLAIKELVHWLRDTGLKWQERDITTHVIQVWLDLLYSALREAIWARDGCVPTINEYMENGVVSFALSPTVLPALYFVGPKLSKEIVQSSEYHNMYVLMSTQGRLLNDMQSFKREFKEGKLNAVTLRMHHGKSGIAEEEEAVDEIKIMVNNQRREMMKLVLEAKGSIVPRGCKVVCWKMCNVLKFFMQQKMDSLEIPSLMS